MKRGTRSVVRRTEKKSEMTKFILPRPRFLPGEVLVEKRCDAQDEPLQPRFRLLQRFRVEDGRDDSDESPIGPLPGESVPEVEELELVDIGQNAPPLGEPEVGKTTAVELSHDHPVDGERPVPVGAHREGARCGFGKNPAAAGKAGFRRVDGFPFALSFVIGDVEVDALPVPVLVVDNDVIAEVQLLPGFGRHGLSGPVP